jgi:hypothetical protein
MAKREAVTVLNLPDGRTKRSLRFAVGRYRRRIAMEGKR